MNKLTKLTNGIYINFLCVYVDTIFIFPPIFLIISIQGEPIAQMQQLIRSRIHFSQRMPYLNIPRHIHQPSDLITPCQKIFQVTITKASQQHRSGANGLRPYKINQHLRHPEEVSRPTKDLTIMIGDPSLRSGWQRQLCLSKRAAAHMPGATSGTAGGIIGLFPCFAHISI